MSLSSPLSWANERGTKATGLIVTSCPVSCTAPLERPMCRTREPFTNPIEHLCTLFTVTLLLEKYAQTIHWFLLLLTYAHLGGVAAACRGWKLCAGSMFNSYHTAFLIRDKHPVQPGIYSLGLCCIRSCLCLSTHYHCFLLVFKTKCSSVSSPSPNPFVSPL